MISELWGNMIGVFTVLILTLFIGIWVWAWRKRHKPVFQTLSELPMADSTEPYRSGNSWAASDAAGSHKETVE